MKRWLQGWNDRRSSSTGIGALSHRYLLLQWGLCCLTANSFLGLHLFLMMQRSPISPAVEALGVWQQSVVPQGDELTQSEARLNSPEFNPTQLGVAPASASSLTLASYPALPSSRDWTYQDWLDRLRQAAMTIALRQPPRLTILLGDSISVYFPQALLPEQTLLNQGISGENSSGLLRRLNFIDRTRPETILIMIGINDLLRGDDDQSLLENQQSIMGYLRDKHPQATIVMQSILPHAVDQVTWEGRDRLLAIPNRHIRELNRRLQVVAQAEQVNFLDLQPIFATPAGDLRRELSTDGLHLNPEGYKVWASALQLYLSRVQLVSQE